MIVIAGIAAVVAGGLALAVESSAGRSSADASGYRHYYSLGKRECARMLHGFGPQPMAGVTQWSGLTTVQIIRFGHDVPPRYRDAMRAGCAAA